MRVIPRFQYGGYVASQDNTRVQKPIIVRKIKYKKPAITDKQAVISQDNRSSYQREQGHKKAQQVYKQYKKDKQQKEGEKNLQGFFTFISPSTYIGPVFNSNGKSYTENVISGKGTGSTVGNITIDILTPFAIGGTKSLVTSTIKKIPYKLNIPVNPNKYYRVVGMDAIDDANKSGLIRWKSTSTNILQDNNLGKKSLLNKLNVGSRSGGVPYFTKGKMYMSPSSGQVVIVGENSIPWKRISPKGRINKYSPEDPINIGNSATPYVNGQFNTASTGAFKYWTRGNNFITKHFYKEHSFNRGSDYTNRLIQLLGSQKNNKNLGTFNFITQVYADYLQSEGVDISKFSSDDLLRLQTMRQKSIIKSNPKQEYITIQQGGITRPQTSYTLRSKDHSNLADMEMIGNRVGNIEAKEPGHKSSEKLYNAGIVLNPDGIISGDLLLSPEITYRVWKKYSDRRIVGRQGIHNFNYGRDVSKTEAPYTINNGEQVLLKSPTNFISPIKSETIFDPSIIDISNYKLKLPNWNEQDIYK